jgi:Uma2 family endonuclease
MTEVVTRKPLKIHTDEFDRMADLGVFDRGRPRIELLGGQLYEMPPIGTAHLILVTRLAQQLNNINAQGRLLIQQPIHVSDLDEPQPDVVVLNQPLGFRKPELSDCLVVIEVSDSTYLYDRNVKVPLYLGSREISSVYIINVRARVLESYCEVADVETNDAEIVPSGTISIGDVTIDVDALFEGFGPGADEP